MQIGPTLRAFLFLKIERKRKPYDILAPPPTLLTDLFFLFKKRKSKLKIKCLEFESFHTIEGESRFENSNQTLNITITRNYKD